MLAIRLIKSPCVTRSIVPNRPYSSLLIIFSWTECGLYAENLGFTQLFLPGGTSILRGWGGLDLTSSSEAKFGARSGQVHQIKGKA